MSLDPGLIGRVTHRFDGALAESQASAPPTLLETGLEKVGDFVSDKGVRVSASVLAMGGAVGSLNILESSAASAATPPAETVPHLIRPTETVDGIAAHDVPGVSPATAKQEIIAINHLEADPDLIRAGKILYLPAGNTAVTGQAAPTIPTGNTAVTSQITQSVASSSHKVVLHGGQTIWTMSRQQGFSEVTFDEDNPGTDPGEVKAGEAYNIPNTPLNTPSEAKPTPAHAPEATPTPPLVVAAPSAPLGTAHITVKAGTGSTFWGIGTEANSTLKIGVIPIVHELEANNAEDTAGNLHIGEQLNTTPQIAEAVDSYVPKTPAPVPKAAPPAVVEPIAPPIAPSISAHTVAPALSSEINTTPEAPADQPYLEQYVIGILQLLAQKMGVPESYTVTPEHVTALIAWAWLEKGDLDNQDSNNIFNSGDDEPDLLSSAPNASGLQSYKNALAGEQATVDTMLGSYQNRLSQVLSQPNSTAVDVVVTLTWFENYSENRPWAAADNPADGYNQNEYYDVLINEINETLSNYQYRATVPIGGTYDENKPHVSPTLLQFNGTSAVSPAPAQG